MRIAARDVSLTLQRQQQTSILNIFPAVVDAITGDASPQVTVRLSVADETLLARVTRKSAELLDLKPGSALRSRKSAELLDLKPGSALYAQATGVALLA